MLTHGSGVKVSSKLTIEWKIDKFNPVLAAAKAGEERCIKSGESAEDNCAGVFIHARGTAADRDNPTATKSWLRIGRYNIAFQIFTGDGEHRLAGPLQLEDHSFESESSWGFPAAVSFGRSATPTLDMLYDDPEHTDVVFRLSGSEDDEPVHLFGLQKLLVRRCYHFEDVFGSGFTESSKPVELDVKSLLTQPLHPFSGDGDDFALFEAALPKDALEDPPIDPEEPWYSRRFDHAIPSSPSPPPKSAVAVPTLDSDEHETFDEPAAKKRKTDSTRSVARVEIEDCSFATFDAFLFYLYTNKLQLLPSVSDFLVAFHDDKQETPSRNVWLAGHFCYSTLPVCIPHGLYRLADRYLASELKKRVKAFIVRSLTVENVAYEAFCQLSVDFDDFQKPVLEFLLEHWDEVKSTKAMEHVLTLLGDGSLPDGAPILKKILAGTTKAPKKKDDKGKEKA
ncbi:hypothetical protein JCM8097_001475 [Rhodosporidiobolus ruineniae]